MNPLDRWLKPAGSGLRASWLGHSTVLIEIDGLRVLTDPVWAQRASPTQLAGPSASSPCAAAGAALAWIFREPRSAASLPKPLS